MSSSGDLLILLGAGASMPGMLSTNDVTDRLRAWTTFREPPATPPVGAPSTSLLLEAIGAPDARAGLFEALFQIASTGVQAPALLNFEHLIHMTEQLASMLPIPPDPKTADRFRSLVAPLLQVRPDQAHWNIPGPNYWAAALAASYEILNWFKDACDRLSRPNHPLAIALRSLARTNSLRIFSLNYDDIPIESGLAFYTGFNNGRFQPSFPWPASGHSLCQLHGSVLFGAAGTDTVSFPTRSAAAAARQSRSSGGVFQDGHHEVAAPMITGLRKADKTMARPFGTYMHVFREELLRVPRWLIVGYGFADEHVNRAMAQARANWAQRGQPVQAVLVNWHQPLTEADGSPILDAWHGTPAAETLEALCFPVFGQDLRVFSETPLPKLAPDLFVELSGETAIDLSGTASALGPHLPRLLEFLDR